MSEARMLYLTTDIRAAEQTAVSDYHLSGPEMMQRAGVAAFEVLAEHFPDAQNIAICCGTGNNGGDGYVLARMLHEAGFKVSVYHTGPCNTQAALIAFEAAITAGVEILPVEEAFDSEIELIVDALLGIGFAGEVRREIASVIRLINDSGLPVLSLDVPSGLDADTGIVRNIAVTANFTVTFMGNKPGLYLLDGPDYAGEIIVDSMGLAKCLPDTAIILLERAGLTDLPERRRNSHKGNFGNVLIIGGGYGMPGAVWLAAMAACRTGSGSVTVATVPEYGLDMLPGLPEVMIYGLHNADDLAPLLERASVVVAGPGLGLGTWARTLFPVITATQVPLVLDASALRLLAENPQHDDNWVLTPHPGEAGVLLDTSSTAIQSDRLGAVAAIQQQYGGIVVLKGAGSLIHDGNACSLCTAGNPGMATAGMGDVLSGIIGGLLAQGMALADAARGGVMIHASAGDLAMRAGGQRGILASDLMPFIREEVNRL